MRATSSAIARPRRCSALLLPPYWPRRWSIFMKPPCEWSLVGDAETPSGFSRPPAGRGRGCDRGRARGGVAPAAAGSVLRKGAREGHGKAGRWRSKRRSGAGSGTADRLKEIQMSEYDAATYERFSGAVWRQVQSLRIILDNLQKSYLLCHMYTWCQGSNLGALHILGCCPRNHIEFSHHVSLGFLRWGSFSDVIKILAALRSNDQAIMEIINTLLNQSVSVKDAKPLKSGAMESDL
ncbi:uncharacterized protein [Marmota flaviventris]|uniref:uncharacterized protein n=1 Tax=Marmota flaviventris TaxID=93162 RepID=UPI003A88161E